MLGFSYKRMFIIVLYVQARYNTKFHNSRRSIAEGLLARAEPVAPHGAEKCGRSGFYRRARRVVSRVLLGGLLLFLLRTKRAFKIAFRALQWVVLVLIRSIKNQSNIFNRKTGIIRGLC